MTFLEIHIQILVHTKKTFSSYFSLFVPLSHSKIHLSNATYLIIQGEGTFCYQSFLQFQLLLQHFSLFSNVITLKHQIGVFNALENIF